MIAPHRGDPNDDVGAALMAKEIVCEAYGAITTEGARAHLADFYDWSGREVSEVERLSRTVRRWEEEPLSFFGSGRSDAKPEAANLSTEKSCMVARGMLEFESYRLRLPLHPAIESKTVPIARVRGHRPRLIA